MSWWWRLIVVTLCQIGLLGKLIAMLGWVHGRRLWETSGPALAVTLLPAHFFRSRLDNRRSMWLIPAGIIALLG